MNLLGKCITVVTLFAPVFAHASERVQCADEEQRYSVSFILESNLKDKQASATSLVFKEGEREIAAYDQATAKVSRIIFSKKLSYEFSLGGMQYFDFDRKRDNNSFTGVFLFGTNPLRADVRVRCIANAI